MNSALADILKAIPLIVVFTGLGFALGQPLLFICIGAVGYSVWSLLQLHKAVVWLQRKDHSEPPESLGLWGRVFDGVYDLQQRSLEEQRRLQAAIDHLQGSFVALSDAVVMVTSSGTIEWCNPAAAKLLGLKYPQDKNQVLVNLIRDPAFIKFFDSEDYHESITIQSPVRPEIFVQYQITLFGQRNRLLFARDVTEIHNLEQMRTDFIANVSHELRTPLTVISGYLETMLSMGMDMPSAWQKAMGQMQDQATQMQGLINDLILLSQLESVQQEQGEPVDMKNLLEAVLKGAQAASQGQHEISLTMTADDAIIGNYNELFSAFSNLAYNAVKYTDAGGEIHIRYYRNKSGVVFAVDDNGIGIEPQHIPRLTERFYRVDTSRSKETGGTGLGLAIVKHVLMRHDAELKVDSRYSKGSTFSAHFPFAHLKLSQREKRD